MRLWLLNLVFFSLLKFSSNSNLCRDAVVFIAHTSRRHFASREQKGLFYLRLRFSIELFIIFLIPRFVSLDFSILRRAWKIFTFRGGTHSRLLCLPYCCGPVRALKSGWVEEGTGAHLAPAATVNFNLRLAHDKNDKRNYEDEADHYGQSVYHGRLFVPPGGSLRWDTRFSCSFRAACAAEPLTT